jgi:hypothetical protein
MEERTDMKRLSLVLFFLFLMASPVLSAEYYVDHSAGDDTAAGSQVAPWQHVPGMSSAIAQGNTLSAGDTVYLELGDSWDETLDLRYDGSSGSRITFTTKVGFGTGANPILAVGVTATSGSCDYNTLENLEINQSGANPVINFQSDDIEELEIKTCEIHGNGSTSEEGIYWPCTQTACYDGLLIEDCNIHDNEFEGIGLGIDSSGSTTDTSFILRRNSVRANCQGDVGSGNCDQITTLSNTEDCLIEYNYIEYTNAAGGSGRQGDGCDINPNHATVTFRWNYVDGRDFSSTLVKVLGAKSDGVGYIYGNVLHDSDEWGVVTGSRAAVGGPLVYLYNNTITDCGWAGISPRTNSIHEMINNIIYKNGYGHSSYPQIFIASTIDGQVDPISTYFTSHNNIMERAEAGTDIVRNQYPEPDAKYSWAQWTAKNCADGTCDQNSVNSDPLFTDYANDDFTLQTGSSPGEDSGTTLVSPYNIVLIDDATYDTDFTTIPPTVYTASQLDGANAASEMGAYIVSSSDVGGGGLSNVVFFWRVDEADFSGTNGTDDYSTGDDVLTTNSGATFNTDAQRSGGTGTNGLDCPSSNDYAAIEVDAATAIITNGNEIGRMGFWWRTISAFADSRSFFRLFKDGGAATDYLEIFTHATGGNKFRVKYEQDNAVKVDIYSTNTFSINTWYYIEIATDTTDGNSVELYINGDLEAFSEVDLSDENWTAADLYLGDSQGVAGADSHFDGPIIITTDPDESLYASRDIDLYSELPVGGAPTIDAIGVWNNSTSVCDTSPTDATTLVGTACYRCAELSEEIITISNPAASSWTTDIGTYTWVGQIQDTGDSKYCLVYYRLSVAGDRDADEQATEITQNDAVFEDGDSNALVLTGSAGDFGDVSYTVPKKNWKIGPTDTDYATYAAFTAANGNDAPGDRFFINGPTETITATASGTASNPIIFMVHKLTGNFDVNSKDYVMIQGVENISGSISNTGTGYQGLYFSNPPGF